MRSVGHFSLSPETVREGAIHRDAVIRLSRDPCWVLSSAIGPPRAWPYATRAVLSGFEQSMAQSEQLPVADRLRRGHDDARAALRLACESLIEKEPPDATLIAVCLEPHAVQVLNVGGGRVYIQRKGQPERLTDRSAFDSGAPDGLVHGEATLATRELRSGDLILAGSATAFSSESVNRVATVLDSDPKVPPSVLASLMTEPARRAGQGSAALALRVG